MRHLISQQSKVMAQQTMTHDVATGATFHSFAYKYLTWALCPVAVHQSYGDPPQDLYTHTEEEVTCEACLRALAQRVIDDRKKAAQ